MPDPVAAYRVEVEAGRISPRPGRIGPGKAMKYTLSFDDTTHEWLRTTAFHARTSIAALVIAALTRAHATQVERPSHGAYGHLMVHKVHKVRG